MQTFTFQSPTKIIFGADTISGVGDIIVELSVNRVLLVTDRVLLQHGLAKPVLDSLEQSGVTQIQIFSDVPPDSDLDSVKNACKQAREHQCDVIIALGGGSVLDTAKVVNIGLSLDGDILDYEGINNLPSPLRPFIAIPTTAGTGSEVSGVAMVKDRSSGKKLLFGSRYLCPDVAILDPQVLVSLPPRLTAATGLDAITHCIESYVAVASNAVSDSLALESVSMLFRNIPNAITNGADLDSRGETLLASSMAGLAFTNAGVGVVHALAHTVGGMYETHHGMTNAVFLPHGMTFNLPAVAGRYARIWRRLHVDNTNGKSPEISASDEEAAEALIQAVKELIAETGLPCRLRDLGVPELKEEDFTELAFIASTDPAIMFNPREATLEDLVDMLKGAY